MRISLNLTLNRDRAAVWRAFDNPDNLKKWQPNLTAFERVSGTPGEPGAVSRLTYVENGRTIQMTETITVRREPEEFGGTYDVGSAVNQVHNRFVDAGGTTRWEIQADFAFRGSWKLLGLIFWPVIVKRVRADAERFKTKLEAGELDESPSSTRPPRAPRVGFNMLNVSPGSPLRGWRLFASWAIAAWEETRRNDLMGQASALAFWLLLSLVPSLALMFAILKAFHLLEAVKPYLLSAVTAGSMELVQAISNYVEAAQGAALGGAGVVTLLVAGFATLSRVKNALNRIWNVEIEPGYGSRLIEYLTVLAVAPVLLLVPVVVSALWDHPALQSLAADFPVLRPLRLLAAEYAGYPVYWLLLFYAYDYLPDARVGWRAALLGAITAGTLLNAAQTFYLRIMLGIGGYNLVYGALALLPILMLWLFLAAVILLFGAQLGYVSQHHAYLLGRRLLTRQLAAERAALALGLLVALLREFRERGEPVPLAPAARRVGLPDAVAAGLAGWLQQAGLIAVVANPAGRYVPAKPPETLTVAEALRRLGAIPVFRMPVSAPSADGSAPEADALVSKELGLLFGEADRALEERLARTRIGELVEQREGQSPASGSE